MKSMKLIVYVGLSLWMMAGLIIGCQPVDGSSDKAVNHQTKKENQSLQSDHQAAQPLQPSKQNIELDLALLQTGVERADTKTYTYPFEVDSQVVKNYASTYQISAKEAQHAMTLSMASPEALNKVLDQIIGEYHGHSLIDGKDMRLVIYTSDNVTPVTFDYVIADNFGKGLVLPVALIRSSSTDQTPQVTGSSLIPKDSH